jgi:phage terminase large subunit-like protein
MWDLSCPDWEDRIREGRSLIADLPLIQSEAEMGLRFFDELQLPDVPELPKLGDAAGSWFRDIVRVAFGSWDPVRRERYIRDILTLAPKGQSKTSYSAGLIIAVMLMNNRHMAEALFVGPTQAISDRAYDQAVGMIELSPDLKRRFRTRDHVKTIVDLVNKSEMKVKTFDLTILTGSILIFVLLDELHLLGRNPHTTKVLRQIRGGLDKTPEGLLLMTTTQSDDVPAGAFRDELIMARKIRDGRFRGKTIRAMLPVLHEFPEDIAKDPAKWQDPANWPMVLPNLGRSAHLNIPVPALPSGMSNPRH